jgi:hypothetical protein
MAFDDLNDFELAPEGPHTAVLVSWIDRGFQQGKFGARRQAGSRFELVDAEKSGEGPLVVFHTVFNLSLKSKVFREMATALMGTSDLKGMPVKDMVGKACKVTIVHKETDDGQTFANIASFKALKPGTAVKQAESDLVFFSLDPADIADLKSLETSLAALPESERTKIAASETYKELLVTLKHVKANKGKKAGDIIDDGFPAAWD